MKVIYKYSLLAIFSLFLMTACKSTLEDQVNLAPIDELPLEDLYKTQANVQRILYASYSYLQEYTQFMRADALYSDQFDLTLQYNNNDRKQFLIPDFGIFNQVGRDLWNVGYTAIGHANLVIYCVDNKTFTASEAEYKRLKGEALFIRAFYHYYLVNFYALPYTSNPTANPGIPIRTVFLATPDEAQKTVGRSRVSEVYTQVEKDLTDAITLLPADNGIFASQNACKAILSRVYFSSEQYSKAYDVANDLISTGGFTFGPKDTSGNYIDTSAVVLRPFRNSSNSFAKDRGYIFQLINSSNNDNSGTLTGEFFSAADPSNIGFKMETATGGLVTELLAEDKSYRTTKLVNVKDGIYFSNKYVRSPVNVSVIRLAELYLTRAESNVLKGGYSETDVLADLNEVRKLNNESLITSGQTQETLLEAIRRERRLELFGEGDRFIEMRRLKLDIPKRYGNNGTGVSVKYNDSKGLLKLPDSEVKANANIEQN